jgi:hypothetical protein
MLRRARDGADRRVERRRKLDAGEAFRAVDGDTHLSRIREPGPARLPPLHFLRNLLFGSHPLLLFLSESSSLSLLLVPLYH